MVCLVRSVLQVRYRFLLVCYLFLSAQCPRRFPFRRDKLGGGKKKRTACEETSILNSEDLSVPCWKNEVKHNVESVPSHLVQCLKSHRDEVLYVAFSPCGTRLASCSRDYRTADY